MPNSIDPTTTAELLARVERESGRTPDHSPLDAWMRAAAHACRAELAERMNAALRSDREAGAKRVHYLSMEFLMGRALSNALAALGLEPAFREAARQAGRDPGEILEREPDAALGNGGLGRLAACFLDSMATLGLPAFGYGLRYEYGMFAQRIRDGEQVEEPDDWLRDGNPWELQRPELRFEVGFGGAVQGLAETGTEALGEPRRWIPSERLHATAWDFIVPGYGTRRVAVLRQWQASPSQPIDLAAFSRGDYAAAGAAKQAAERINWVLYPDDSTATGRRLRLRQEYFLVSASLQDLIARHLEDHGDLQSLGAKAAIHLNDTHPALAVPELLRLLLDEHAMSWDEALAQCKAAFSYTNHTLLPEALETWPVPMLEELLPRHLELIYALNSRFLAQVRAAVPGDEGLIARVSLIDESGQRHVRMAPLSIIASHKVNGVSKLHSELMVETIFADYAKLLPHRFCNVTNGVTPRRWLAQANAPLARLLDQRLGTSPDWRTQLHRLAELAPLATDAEFCAQVQAAKAHNKQRLAARIEHELGLCVDPSSLFDVHIKRIHEYKRQLLKVLDVVARYQAICAAPEQDWLPRTVVIAGKAASAYAVAKLIIRLIHDVAAVVNNDPRVAGRLRVVFLPNYGVSLGEVLFPAADLSEQISTAGTEASGTGNMKFALNGALTIGTWDGATIEMAEAVGREHFFIFGLDAVRVRDLRAQGYEPRSYYNNDPTLRAVLDAIASGAFSPAEPDRYQGLIARLLERDTYLLLADFADYRAAQVRVDALYRRPEAWAERAVLNIAGMGAFSSDRTIRDYARTIWAMPTPD
ncbi:Maltodextrin phosphorylase [Enhygromyxa salina]|uniref:Alpha-1,4 glucan phosphorylase n=1 Tax=Enhygromyxa salina TaxID=215803 RepID=A0A2S9XIN7_9BACT|nr:glycogen/starch/alpha-glucan phosphorylase [Enhygromyxa salina]PRP92713.1 Maltodextrin phosphorylase [Enhygromyxa salina]